jgi:transcriptional regulator with XRE-family HTH domain
MDPAKLLREARRRSRLSQHEVAARAGCSQSVVARVESGDRDPYLAKFERMLAACGFQIHAELEPLDTRLDQEIEAMAEAKGPTSLYLLSQDLVTLIPPLVEADIPLAVDGVAAATLYGFPLPRTDVQLRIQGSPDVLMRFAEALPIRRDTEPSKSPHCRDLTKLPRLHYVYDLCDPDSHWLADRVQFRVRTQVADPSIGAVCMTVKGYLGEVTVPVVPLQRLILPRQNAQALERMRLRHARLDSAGSRTPCKPS